MPACSRRARPAVKLVEVPPRRRLGPAGRLPKASGSAAAAALALCLAAAALALCQVVERRNHDAAELFQVPAGDWLLPTTIDGYSPPRSASADAEFQPRRS